MHDPQPSGYGLVRCSTKQPQVPDCLLGDSSSRAKTTTNTTKTRITGMAPTRNCCRSETVGKTKRPCGNLPARYSTNDHPLFRWRLLVARQLIAAGGSSSRRPGRFREQVFVLLGEPGGGPPQVGPPPHPGPPFLSSIFEETGKGGGLSTPSASRRLADGGTMRHGARTWLNGKFGHVPLYSTAMGRHKLCL